MGPSSYAFRGISDLLVSKTFTKSARDHRGVDLISDALPFSQLWYAASDAASNA
jgi:hypothetical protein